MEERLATVNFVGLEQMALPQGCRSLTALRDE